VADLAFDLGTSACAARGARHPLVTRGDAKIDYRLSRARLSSLKVLDCHEGDGWTRPTGGIRGEAAQGADQELEGGRARGLEAKNLAPLDGLLTISAFGKIHASLKRIQKMTLASMLGSAQEQRWVES
jgi:hypothetical protein